MNRSTSIALAVLLMGAFAVPAPAHAAPGDCWSEVGTDIDGDGPDVVIGLPSFDLPGKPDAGAIVVYSNVGVRGENAPRTPSARTLLTADDIPGLASQAGARFGASVVVWDSVFDDPDHCGEVIVGAPGQNVDGKAGAGRVYRIGGSPSGLTTIYDTLDEAELAGAGGAQAGAGFGATLGSLSRGTIAVGVPGRDVAGAADAGRVVRLDYLTGGGPKTLVVEQGGANAGEPEAGDRFGEVLTVMPTGDGDVVLIGIPGEDIGNKTDAGAVGLLPPGAHLSMVSQDSPGAGGSAEPGDRYGAAIAGHFTFDVDHPVGVVAIGVPGEDVGSRSNAGAVSFARYDFFLSPGEGFEPIAGMRLVLTQDSPGIPGAVEAGDAFGSAVVTGEFGRENQELVVGSPGENLGSIADAGLATMTRIEPFATPSTGTQPGSWSQDSAGVSGASERGDRFGSKVTAVTLTALEDDDDVLWSVNLLTVPGEDLGRVPDAGMAYLGFAPGRGSVELVPPVAQAGAGLGMVPMQVG